MIYIHEYSGLAANSPLDQASTQTGTGTAVTSGAKTTTQANELIFGTASVDHGCRSRNWIYQAPDCRRQHVGRHDRGATGSYAATFTQNVSGGWEGAHGYFRGRRHGTTAVHHTNGTDECRCDCCVEQRNRSDVECKHFFLQRNYLHRFSQHEFGFDRQPNRQRGNRDVYHDTSVSAGTTYYYEVEGTNAGGTSGLSNQASATSLTSCTTPTAPTSAAATGVSSSEIDLTWNASTSSCSGITYTVFRSTTSGSTGTQITSGVAATSYHDTTVSAGTTYYYEVEGVNAGGTSGLSNQASATSLTSPPPTTSSIAIDTGSTAAVNAFAADEYFSGGTMYSTANTINTSKVPDPAPAAVYQTHRYGTFTYVIPGLTPGANYLVRLHFCEVYWGALASGGVGSRVFNVSINSTSEVVEL